MPLHRDPKKHIRKKPSVKKPSASAIMPTDQEFSLHSPTQSGNLEYGKDFSVLVDATEKDTTKMKTMMIMKTKTYTATTTVGRHRGRKVRDGKGARRPHIELGRPSSRPKVAVRQQAAPEPPTESCEGQKVRDRKGQDAFTLN